MKFRPPSRWMCSIVAMLFLINSAVADEPVWIDLLEQVDPAVHSVTGQWRKTGTTLSTTALPGSRLKLPWKPTAEYDLEVTFTRTSGSNSIALIFVSGGNQATFDIDGWGQHLAGIQNIDGQTMRDNPTRVANQRLTNGDTHTALLRVRKNDVQALLDGKELCRYRGDGSKLSLLDLWRLPEQNTLGIGAWDSATTFSRIRVRPVAGSPTVASAMPPRPTAPHRPATTPSPASPSPSPAADDDLVQLSDEFDDPSTLANWRRVYRDEQTRADQLQTFDIGRTRRGWMTLVPHTSTWYQDYRGVLVYKPVEGDFVVTTHVRATNRAGNGPPRSSFSLAGIMVRTPREITPQSWEPGGENYIFLSLGAAREAGRFAFEVKTTQDSRSSLEILETAQPEALIQVARLGSDFVLLRKVGDGPWSVHRRYRRPDMPARLQVGFTVYTDYNSASRVPPLQQNTQVIRGGTPDLRASFDYLRFRRPEIPADLQGRQFSDSQTVPDRDLLRFLGDGPARATADSLPAPSQ
jgi:hypothetical protein